MASIKNLTLFRIILFSLTVFISGCTTAPEKKPFEEFATSVKKVNEATKKLIETLVPEEENQYKEKILEELITREGDLVFSSTLILKDDNFFEFENEDIPSYLVYREFRSGLGAITDAFHNYTEVLNRLANDEIQSEEELKTLTKELNTNAFDVINILSKEKAESTDNEIAENIGIISPIAVTVLNNYLKIKQKSVLIDAITQNQVTVENYTEKAKQAITIIAKANTQTYNANAQELQMKLSGIELNTDEEKIEATSTIDTLVKANKDYYTQIKSLKALYETIDAFPDAHKNLISAAKNPDISLDRIIALVDQGNKLIAMVDDAQKENKGKLLEAKNNLIKADATQAEAQALVLETDAKLAALEAAKAKADAIIARIAATENPDDPQKQQEAKRLEKHAEELKEIAEKKEESAQLIREAVNAIKTSVGNLVSLNQ
jgi:hypothetical protein